MKILVAILLLFIPFLSYSQRWIVTPEGLRNGEDTSKKYVTIDAGTLSARKLYDNALRYIAANYPKPDEAIRIKWDSVDLMFDTFVPDFLIYNNTGAKLGIEAFYTTELRFDKGSVRYEIINLEMKGDASNYKLLFKGNWLKSYIVYKNNGKIFKPQTKRDIEYYFNEELSKIASFINHE
jgi:hypothetical protein